MEQMNEQEYGIVLSDLLMALKSRILLILAATLATAAMGWGAAAFLLTPRYEATVNMIVNARTDMSAMLTVDTISISQNLADTYAIIIKSNTVLNQVIDSIGLDTKYEALYEDVTVNAIGNTQVMKIAVEHEDPAMASRIVEAITQVAPAVVTEAVEAGSCKVISDIYVEEDPVFPDVQKFTIIAAVLGLLVSMAAIVLKELMNDFIVDDMDVERKLGIPTLSMIPDVEVK